MLSLIHITITVISCDSATQNHTFINHTQVREFQKC